jgi:hypothetical protein
MSVVTRSSLSNTAAKDFAAVTVKLLAAKFDATIQKNAAEGLDIAYILLPIHFAFPNFPTRDMQLLVYTELYRLYTEPNGRGFKHATIDLSVVTRPVFAVRWENGLSDVERRERSQILKAAATPMRNHN